jgi:hypothetical protein
MEWLAWMCMALLFFARLAVLLFIIGICVYLVVMLYLMVKDITT